MTASSTEHNKKIAKNSIIMYIRMVVVMAISLYTSRIVLRSLGVEDYGIYNLVGGLVVFFTVINTAMLSATQRFLNYGIGKGEQVHLSQIFKTACIIHILLAAIVILAAETIGLWLLWYKLQIPQEKADAAFIVFQLSVVTVVVQIVSLPFNAVVVAHERISVIAWMSIIMAVLNFGVAATLTFFSAERLEYYTFLTLGVQVVIALSYVFYSRTHFAETKGRFSFDKKIFKEMTVFSGWCMVGCTAGIMYSQGLNILLGMFFLPFVNAARGIAVTVQNAVNQIFNNVQTAVVPQLIQSYAREDWNYFYSLIFKSSKFFSFLLLLVAIPLFIRMEYVLRLWLGELPEYSVIFTRILIGVSLIDAISASLMRASDATGDIRKYHLVVGGVLLLIVPIAYICLKMGCPPQSVFYTYLAVSIGALGARLIILRDKIKLPVWRFCSQVLARICIVLIISFPLCLLVADLVPMNFWGFVTFFIMNIIIIGGIILLIGLTRHERTMILSKLKLKR